VLDMQLLDAASHGQQGRWLLLLKERRAQAASSLASVPCFVNADIGFSRSTVRDLHVVGPVGMACRLFLELG
jgi:hypothetical protein